MPRFQVTMTRAYKSVVLIDADDAVAARALSGQIVDEAETDSWGESTDSVEQVDDEQDCADLG